MPFLDVLIRISTNNNIITDIFSKDTNTHKYLNFRSSHPKHIKINIPFNLASRIITITNTEELRDTGLRELRLYLKNQQYPEEIVEHGIQEPRLHLRMDGVLQLCKIYHAKLRILQGRIQDFKLGGGGRALKKIASSRGRHEIFGVFRVKNHDFTPKKNLIFFNCRGRRENV